MSLLDDITARIEAQVPDLAGKVGSFADLSALFDREFRPRRAVTAWVVPGGMTGGPAHATIGRFSQVVTRSVVVALAWRISDATGAAGLPGAEATVDAVVAALLGYEPPSASSSARGVLQLRSGETFIRAGALACILEFTIEDEAP